MKNNSKGLAEELEKLNKKYEKVKGQNANLKINEKKLLNDNNALAAKVQTLNKENNELKHRLNKLLNISNAQSNSRSQNKRLGSNAPRAVKRCAKKQGGIFGKKYSQACASPRIKKVGSDRCLLPLNCNPKTNKFGRRETLDVNKSGPLLLYGLNEDSNTRNSDLINLATSEDERSIHFGISPKNKIFCKPSRNEFEEIRDSQNRSLEYNRLVNGRNKPCNCRQSSRENNSCIHDHNAVQASQRFNPDYRYSNINNVMVEGGRESIEKELYHQVSNVVSSFFNKIDHQPNHCRQKSKSDLGFVRSVDNGYLNQCNNGSSHCEGRSGCNHSLQRSNIRVMNDFNRCQNSGEKFQHSCNRGQAQSKFLHYTITSSNHLSYRQFPKLLSLQREFGKYRDSN